MLRRFTTVGCLVSVTACGGAPVEVGESTERITRAERARYANFNGDKFSDLVMVTPYEGLSAEGAGSVTVIYGSSLGLDTTITPQQWSLDTPGVPAVGPAADAGAWDGFGAATAWGDFDDNGASDLAIGIPARAGGGAVLILYGQIGVGLTADASRLLQFTDFYPWGLVESDGFGGALAAGDFDGDGTSDLAIGLPNRTNYADGVVGAGAVLLAHGVAGSGLDPTDFMHFIPGIAPLGTTFPSPFFNTNFEYGRFGYALAAGNDDDDLADELAIGAPWAFRDSGFGEEGAVYLLDFIGWTGSLCHVSALMPGWSDYIPGNLGYALAMGDFTGDGRDDIAVGAPTDHASDAGAVHLFKALTDPSGLCADNGITFISPSSTPYHLEQGDLAPEDIVSTDRFGSSVALADIDNDGKADLIVGAYPEGEGAVTKAGVAWVLKGTVDGVDLASKQRLSQADPAITGTANEDDRFGYSFVVGDFDKRFGADVAVAVPYDTSPRYVSPLGIVTPSVDNAGSYEVFYSAGGGALLSTTNEQLWTQNTPGVPDSCETSDRMGLAFGWHFWLKF
jgi:hypothetical protein